MLSRVINRAAPTIKSQAARVSMWGEDACRIMNEVGGGRGEDNIRVIVAA